MTEAHHAPSGGSSKKPNILGWVVAVAAVVVTLGFFGWLNSGPSPSTHAGLTQGSQTYQPPRSVNCPGEPEAVTPGHTPFVVNPYGRCRVRWRVTGGRVEILNMSGQAIRTIGPEGGDFTEFFQSVRAVEGSPTFNYTLVPP